MDIDRYIQLHDAEWNRLGQLASRAGGLTRGSLTDPEIDELISAYQRTSAQLSHVRTTYGDPDLILRLSRILGDARLIIYRKRSNPLRAVRRFFTEGFPAAVWVSRRFVLVAFLCLMVPAVLMGFWLANDPAVLDASIPPELQQSIADSEFRDYYSSDAAQNFAGTVTVNNIMVSFMALAMGLLPVLGPVFILAYNGLNVGVMAAVMHSAGEGAQFWGLITPHGLLELSAIIIAGAAGLRISWAIVAPGDRNRSTALAEEGLRAVVIVLGLTLSFLVAGLVEGFVTPSGMPTALRVAIGIAVLGVFIAYVVTFGQRAERAGLTGLLDELTRDDIERAEEQAARGVVIRA
ncbi:MAG: stage II sporulation protein M [Microthrixaceae bacterium]